MLPQSLLFVVNKWPWPFPLVNDWAKTRLDENRNTTIKDSSLLCLLFWPFVLSTLHTNAASDVTAFASSTHFHSAHNQLLHWQYTPVSNGMQWLNINFKLFGIFCSSPRALDETWNSGTLLAWEWLMWPDEPGTVNHPWKLMQWMPCDYMITDDPDKIVMGLHYRWYLI